MEGLARLLVSASSFFRAIEECVEDCCGVWLTTFLISRFNILTIILRPAQNQLTTTSVNCRQTKMNGAPPNVALKSSLGKYVESRNWRTILDWVEFACCHCTNPNCPDPTLWRHYFIVGSLDLQVRFIFFFFVFLAEPTCIQLSTGTNPLINELVRKSPQLLKQLQLSNGPKQTQKDFGGIPWIH